MSRLYSEGRYEEGMQIFLGAEGEHPELARKVIAGYISYAFHRVGEVTETINGIDRIMGMGFNWAQPSVLVDTMGRQAAVEMIDKAGLPVPANLAEAAKNDDGAPLFQHPTINPGRFFVAG